MGDGRAEGPSAIGDGGQAAVSLTPDVDGTHVRIFESSQLEGSYVGDLLYYYYSFSFSSPSSSLSFPPHHYHEHFAIIMKHFLSLQVCCHTRCV